jgi:hypothetical protein
MHTFKSENKNTAPNTDEEGADHSTLTEEKVYVDPNSQSFFAKNRFSGEPEPRGKTPSPVKVLE